MTVGFRRMSRFPIQSNCKKRPRCSGEWRRKARFCDYSWSTAGSISNARCLVIRASCYRSSVRQPTNSGLISIHPLPHIQRHESYPTLFCMFSLRLRRRKVSAETHRTTAPATTSCSSPSMTSERLDRSASPTRNALRGRRGTSRQGHPQPRTHPTWTGSPNAASSSANRHCQAAHLSAVADQLHLSGLRPTDSGIYGNPLEHDAKGPAQARQDLPCSPNASRRRATTSTPPQILHAARTNPWADACFKTTQGPPPQQTGCAQRSGPRLASGTYGSYPEKKSKTTSDLRIANGRRATRQPVKAGGKALIGPWVHITRTCPVAPRSGTTPRRPAEVLAARKNAQGDRRPLRSRQRISSRGGGHASPAQW